MNSRKINYKASNVSWIGDVPEHWSKTKFKYLLDEKQKTQNDELPLGSISFGNVVYKRSDKITDETRFSYQEVLSGEFLINPLNLNFDLKSLRTALSEINVIVSSGYIVLTSNKKANKTYLKWLLHIFDMRHMKTLGSGIRQTITFKDIGNSEIYIPSYPEQISIGNYLDQEVSRVDKLVDEKQNFIKLLKEKRQALIAHIVTKGLDPDIDMKDSEISWIGEIPSHWNAVPLKYICRFSGGGTPSKENLEFWKGTIPWVSPKDMKAFWLKSTKDKITNEAIEGSSTSLIEPGAVLIVVRSGVLRKRIPVAINTVQVTLNQDMKALRFDDEDVALFFAHFIQGFNDSLLLEWRKQGATVESIEYEYLSKTLIPIPTDLEIKEINNKIKERTQIIDMLILETSSSIELLKERRTALISAAVTGKIDLRDKEVA